MKCPICETSLRVVSTKAVEGRGVARNRKCPRCDHRLVTKEITTEHRTIYQLLQQWESIGLLASGDGSGEPGQA